MRTIADIHKVIDGLAYDFTAFTLPDFLAHLERQRHRPIIVGEYPFQTGVYGLWCPAPSADYIFVNRTAHSVHRIHIILHEVAHMLLGHRLQDLRTLLGPELASELGMGDEFGYLRSASSLQVVDNPEELEAERFVMLVRGAAIRAERFGELIGEGTSLDYRQSFIRALDLGEV